MTNKIQITACDNELYLIAYQLGKSYQIAHIKSGNFNPVNVSIDITSGIYSESQTLDGITQALNEAHTVNLPQGSYTLVASGINWGGPYSFAFNLNDTPYHASGPAGDGVIWSPPGVPLNI